MFQFAGVHLVTAYNGDKEMVKMWTYAHRADQEFWSNAAVYLQQKLNSVTHKI